MSNAELQALLDERAIRDVIFRYTHAVDRFDWAMLSDCFHPDAVLEYGAKSTPADWIAGAERGLSTYRFTQHAVSNVIVESDGSDVARAQSYCLARHRIPGTDGKPDTDFLWGGRYVDRFERRDGAWRIAHRIVVHEWTKYERVEATWPNAASFTQGERGPDDIYYRVRRP